MRLKESKENENKDVMGESKASTPGGRDDASQGESITPKIDLSGLTDKQQHVVKKCYTRNAVWLGPKNEHQPDRYVTSPKELYRYLHHYHQLMVNSKHPVK